MSLPKAPFQPSWLRIFVIITCWLNTYYVELLAFGTPTITALLPDPSLIVLLLQVMQKFASKLLPRAYSAKAVQKDNAHLDQSNTILDNAIAVLQQLADLESATFNVLGL